MKDTPRIEFVVYPTGALLAIAEQLRDVGAHQTMHLEGRLRPGSLGEAMMELGEAAAAPGIWFKVADGYEGNMRRLTAALDRFHTIKAGAPE